MTTYIVFGSIVLVATVIFIGMSIHFNRKQVIIDRRYNAVRDNLERGLKKK